MKNKHRLAIIDTLVNKNIVDTEKIVLINDKETLKDELYEERDENISHGTLCAQIVKRYDSDLTLICIKVLEDDGVGTVLELEKALEWCFRERIFIVNLSLGTINPLQREKLLLIVNYYANRGMIIIAATSNKGLRTYPASFSNVIGVASNEVMNCKQLNSSILGIDIQGKAEHVIEIRGYSVKTPKSNSFATPYVSVIVEKLIEKINDNCCVSVIKNELYNSDYCTYPMASCNAPDWITTAYFANVKEKGINRYYFKVGTIKEADTIIVNSKETLEIYKKYKKHMVYLGEEEVTSLEPLRFFWSKQNKIRQINNVHISKRKIKIPIMLIDQSDEMNDIEILCELRKQFGEGEYNIYAISTKIESVLYDLEYIPEELLEQRLQIYSFVYAQTFVQQSNMVIFATNSMKKMQKIFPDVDIKVEISTSNDLIQLSMMCNQCIYETVYNQYVLEELVTDLYKKVIAYYRT